MIAMKGFHNILWQGLILSLTTQLVLSLMVDNENSPSASSSSQSRGIIGTLHRSAAIKASSEEEQSVAQSARGQRCVRCTQPGYYGGNGYADRMYDDYYYRDRAAYYGREDPYRDQYYQQRDRNWYYQPEYRNPYDRSYNRYDDRYYGREEQPYPVDNRYNSNYNSYRGNDRGYSYDQYYDRFYDRPGYRAVADRGYYDNRNFRPYDETYRGTAGFDNSGRGYYFAGHSEPRPTPAREPYPGSRDPYEYQAQRPQSSSQHQSHYNQPHLQHTTSRVPPEFWNDGKAVQTPNIIQTVSSGAIGTVDSKNSSTLNNKNSNNEIDEKDKDKIRLLLSPLIALRMVDLP